MWEQFQVGFWHPFGAYTGLSGTEALDWKGDEVVRHGWTFPERHESPHPSFRREPITQCHLKICIDSHLRGNDKGCCCSSMKSVASDEIYFQL
jgi:hypothetical protein